jgi:arylformamidase
MNQSPEPGLIDVSRPLSNATTAWPGDVPFRYRLGLRIRDGASINLGAVETSLHTATHCDAPYHYDDSGPKLDQVPTETFVGPAWVVDVSSYLGRWRDRLERLDFHQTPRVLFRTGAWPDTNRFPERIRVMEPELPDWLGQKGAVLIGVDQPSVDEVDSKTLTTHHALGRNRIIIVEGLWLEGVAEGRYELLAAPLKIVGADGSPLRALLRPIR